MGYVGAVVNFTIKVAGSVYVCDHCRSASLVRTGNRPQFLLGVATGKKEAVFRCESCGEESAFSRE